MRLPTKPCVTYLLLAPPGEGCGPVHSREVPLPLTRDEIVRKPRLGQTQLIDRASRSVQMTVSVLLEGHLIDGERDGFTALLTEKFKLTKTFDGFQKIDLTYNVEDPNNWVITELWDSKEDYQKYLQFRQDDGTLDEVASICEDAPSVRIFDIVDTA